MKILKKIDRHILHELELNARQSDTQIARKLRISRDRVRYRIKKMMDDGRIRNFMTILNTMTLGYDWYRTFFKFHSLTIEQEKEVVDWFYLRCCWIVRIEGKWDFNVGIFTSSVYEYWSIVRSFVDKFGHILEQYEPSIVTRMWHYPRDYLIESKSMTKPLVMGFGPDQIVMRVQIDRIDDKLLRLLAKNARMSTVDIARSLDITEPTVRARMRKLESNGVILGYRPFLDIGKLGYVYFKVHMMLTHTPVGVYEKILAYLHAHTNTAYTTELVGGSDIETEFQVQSNEELYGYIRDIRQQFPGSIRSYEFMQYTKEHKFSYLPEQR